MSRDLWRVSGTAFWGQTKCDIIWDVLANTLPEALEFVVRSPGVIVTKVELMSDHVLDAAGDEPAWSVRETES